MRGNGVEPSQCSYMQMESHTNNGLSSSNDALSDTQSGIINSSQMTCVPNIRKLPAEYDSDKSVFQRRKSVQSTSSLNRSLMKSYHRRGSIPCLLTSVQQSPQLSPKKSHTAPNPFPELINSPPPTPSVDHRRSRSSNMDDSTWLTPEELDDSHTTSASFSSTQQLIKQDSQTSDGGMASPVKYYSSPLQTQLSQTNLQQTRSNDLHKSDARLHGSNQALARNETRFLYKQMSSSSDSLRNVGSVDRYSPPNSRGSPVNGAVERRSPECKGAIYEQASALITPHGYTKQMLKVYTDEKNSKTVTINEIMSACEVCHMIVDESGYTANKSWSLIEVLPKFSLERSLEDHELVYAIYRSWSNSENNRFNFMKDLRKYKLFHNQTQPFPAHMLEATAGNSPKGSPKVQSKSQQRQAATVLHNLLLDSELIPDIQSHLHMKDAGKKTWKKHFFVLRKSGLYCSTKGSSKDPKHLTLVSQLSDVNIYSASNAKKKLGAPNNYCFCLKAAYTVSDVKDLRLFCADDDVSRDAWIGALRLIKYGEELKEDYRKAARHEAKLQSIENHESVHKTYGKLNPNAKNRVAMDFTGQSGRVVDDPNEALGVALEEAQHLRMMAHRAEHLRQAPHHRSSSPQQQQQHGGCMPLHVTQPWFHCSISREHAVHAIHHTGMMDGVFLVRESQSMPGSYVLSLAHAGKVKHCTIKTFEYEGDMFYSMDGGQTKFLDLIQLIEFYQLNTSGLPCRLSEYVNRV